MMKYCYIIQPASTRCRQLLQQSSWQQHNHSIHVKGKHRSATRVIKGHRRNPNKAAVLGPPTVDYSLPPPIIAPPPAPPRPKGIRGYFFMFPMIIAVCTTAYFYKYNKNDNYEFWEAMQSGKGLPEEAFEDDDDEDDDEEEE